MLTAAQIVTLAVQMSGVQGYTAQAGQLLNMILSDLCQTYDLDLARGTTIITLGGSSGPYALPGDYLRADYEDVFFTLNGVKYPLVPIDLYEFDLLVQQPGNLSYPSMYATDVSFVAADPATGVLTDSQGNVLLDSNGQPLLANETTSTVASYPVLYCWPPSSGAYPLTVRYRRQMPDIATPETSNVVPWFPNQTYLVTRLAGELMKIADDDRSAAFLGDGESGAQGILERYLQLKDDRSNRASAVKVDRRFFGSAWNKVPNTKQVGW